MGGFRVNVEDFSDNFPTAALSPEAVLKLVRNGFICHTDPSTIEDKSEANNLAKILVTFQVSRMAIQYISRRVQGLPLTLLEIHTFIHAICAATMYAFWFEKPLDIGEASLVQVSQALESFIAIIFLYSEPFHATALDGLDKHNKAIINILPASLQHCEERTPPATSILALASFPYDFLESLPKLYYYFPENLPTNVKLAQFWISPAENRHIGITLPRPLVTCALVARRYTGHIPALDADGNGFALLATERLENEDLLRADLVEPLDHWLVAPMVKLAQLRLSILKAAELHPKHRIWTLISMFLVQAIYGGVNLPAWEALFPSRPEQMLWRASCILIATFMIAASLDVMLFTTIVSFGNFLSPKDRVRNSDLIRKKIISRIWGRLWEIILIWGLLILFAFLLLVLATAAARCHIVVESFISLRTVPTGAYKAIDWADYIPHI